MKPKEKEAPTPLITQEDLDVVSNWLRNIDLTSERKNFINEKTQDIISQMGIVDPDNLKKPYTV